MTARNGMRVTIQNGGTKPWVRVWTPEEGSLVAFEDLFEMIRGIVRCEAVKYGGDPDNPESWARWAKMPREFMHEALAFDATFDALKAKYQFPPRTAAAPPVSITSAPATAATFVADDDFYAAWDAIEARTRS
jgi:hypothetical protein